MHSPLQERADIYSPPGPTWREVRIPPEQLTAHGLTLLAQIAECRVGHRPGRIESRVIKRHRHAYKAMQQPRRTLQQLRSGNPKH